MPSYYLTNGYGIVDLGKDGVYDLLADDGIRENTQVIYTYSDGEVQIGWKRNFGRPMSNVTPEKSKRPRFRSGAFVVK